MPPRAHHRRGGIRQRLASRRHEERADDATDDDVLSTATGSSLARNLLTRFAWGQMSPQTVQDMAKSARRDLVLTASRVVAAVGASSSRKKRKRREEDEEDGSSSSDEGNTTFLPDAARFVPPELDVMGKLGASGQYPNKIYGQLMAKTEAVISLPACFEHKFSFVKPRKAEFRQLLMLPHLLFSHIYHNEKALWHRAFVASSQRLEDFWSAVKAVPHPAWVKHPLRLQEEAGKRSTKKCVPLSIHGDEVPVAGLGKVWGRKMVNWSFSSLAGLGSTKSSQFWIWGMFEKVGVPGKTLEEFFEVLRWSLFWLWLGLWPETDVNGEGSLVVG